MHGYNGPELHNSNQVSFPNREDEYSENLSMLIWKGVRLCYLVCKYIFKRQEANMFPPCFNYILANK